MAQPHTNPFAPTPPHSRDSGIGAIGALLSTPYEEDEDDDTSIYSGPASPPILRRDPVARGQAQDAMAHHVKSIEGEMTLNYPGPSLRKDHGHGGFGNSLPSVNNGLGLVPGSPRRAPPAPVRSTSGGHLQPEYHVALGGRPLPPRSNTEPMQVRPGQAYGGSYPPQPHPRPYQHQQQGQQRPQPPAISTSLSPPRSILLPAPASPISPLLAAPPQPHFSPMAPPSPLGSSSSIRSGRSGIAPHARASSISESIRGFDTMAEKKACFREGQEELLNPFSPGPRIHKPSGLREETSTADGMDFWKRFSTSAHLNLAEKKKGPTSDWLSKAQSNRGTIKKIVIVCLVLIILIVAAIVVIVLLIQSKKNTTTSDKLEGNL